MVKINPMIQEKLSTAVSKLPMLEGISQQLQLGENN